MSQERAAGQFRGRVLVIDDDASMREAVIEGLEKRGYQAAGAADGIEAFDRLERSGAPDVVVLDLSMPGMNGWEFLEELRDDGTYARVPVVVVTGCPDAKVPDADAFIVKPAQLEEILRAVEEEIELSRED
ncbi:MAG TPA: response regulator [Myxococcaceae bacterium]|nr:response regulator [Myxococcaceae bacterium]